MSNQIAAPETTPIVESTKQNHPSAFYFFFWGEFAERSSYYGMRAILPLYLTSALHFSDAVGGAIYFWFKMTCYALPLLGGFLADRYFGKYRTIVSFAIPYVLGHFVLGIESPVAALIALILLAGGSGVIKPNISTLMGETYDQQRPGQIQLRSAAFMWFYFAINVGALISTSCMPYLRDKYGYAAAFQFPAWLMAFSLAVFASGKNHYAKEKIERPVLTPEQRSERWAAVRQLLGIFGLIALYWIPYEHNDSIWVFFTRDYVDLNVPDSVRNLPAVVGLNFSLLPERLAPDQLQTINPLFVLLFAPLFAWLFPKIDPTERVITNRLKILLGFGSGTAASLVMAIAGFLANGETKISLLWLAFAYILLTIGEVLVYGTGLDLAFSAAPANMKGVVTGCFLLTTTLANFFNSFWVHFYGGSLTTPELERGPLAPGVFFAVSGLFALLPTVLMAISNPDKKHQPDPAT